MPRPTTAAIVADQDLPLECGCVNHIGGQIAFCPIHAAAPDLLAAAHGLLCEVTGMLGNYEADLREIMLNTNTNALIHHRDALRAAIAKAKS